MKIAVIGTGYVGLVTGACFSETGNDVICIDTDQEKLERIRSGEMPFYEPGLPELASRNMREGRLTFSDDLREPLSAAEIAFICVGTPSNEDGSANLDYVFQAVDTAAEAMQENAILTIKSTVPIGTSDKARARLLEKGRGDIHVASNPEFLREGAAVQDCLMPDRVVVGLNNMDVADLFRGLYAPFLRTGKPLFVMDVRSAEMTKYAANSLLASRISFINEISMLCERVGADVSRVREAMGADHRIGLEYLFPSVGFGGSCFPKDVRALASLAQEHGMNPDMLQAILTVNEAQKHLFVSHVLEHFESKGGIKNKQIAVWGLSFKAKTDDIRESPALTVVDQLLEAGAKPRVYDPVSIPNTRSKYGEKLTYASSTYDALKGSDALCVLTEWNQFRHPDFKRIKKELNEPTIFDGRNLYDPKQLQKLGFTYYSVGRPGSE